MKGNIDTRVKMEVYLCYEGYSIREIAKYLKVSKSTVHKDLHDKRYIDSLSLRKVQKCLTDSYVFWHTKGFNARDFVGNRRNNCSGE